MVHVQGGCRLLEQRGPPSQDVPFNGHLYCRLRTVAVSSDLPIICIGTHEFKFYDACGRRKSTVLARPEWRAISQKGEAYDELLDILVCIPTILELSDREDSSTYTPSEPAIVMEQLLDWSYTTEEELLNWYWGVQNNEQVPLFWVDNRPPEHQSLLDEDSDLIGTFPEAVLFSNPYTTQLMLLYWCASVILYPSMAQMQHKLRSLEALEKPLSSLDLNDTSRDRRLHSTTVGSSPRRSRARELKEIESTGDYFATKVCQSMAFCAKHTTGALGFQAALSRLWAAQQFFDGRSNRKFRWCQMALKNFKKQGFGLGTAIGELSHKQYADIGKEN